MFPANRPAPMLIWTLCLAVLLGVQLCGLHHGQASGLTLSGLQGGYCSASPTGFAPFMVERAEPDGDWTGPLCQNPASGDDGWPLGTGLRNARGALLPGRRSAPCRPRRQLLAWPRAP